MARKTTTARTTPKTVPVQPAECGVCKGSGQVTVSVRVGRKHRNVVQQEGFCLACFGPGTTTS
ncbi:hypothetical protein [Streptomyces sp. NPDC088261]|uniref:hypothetical protein n=1 Tax=Streptomyces sp. NPDC088261 TaxID=3365851 RepID=UPI00381F14C8